jgi:hypothetical protein
MDAFTKFRSEDLKHEAATGNSNMQAVVVELDLPRGQVMAVPRAQHDIVGGVRFRLGTSTPSGEGVENRINDTRRAIETIVGRSVDRFFQSSGSLVIEANGEQLRRIAELPYVAAIWPNSAWRKGSAA